jgi:outer membrane protein assembly factor BamD (BamD/ComL family)
MKGFVCAEDLNQKGEALEIFQNLVEDYPDGELNESAEYMIQELEGKNNVIEKIKEENK